MKRMKRKKRRSNRWYSLTSAIGPKHLPVQRRHPRAALREARRPTPRRAASRGPISPSGPNAEVSVIGEFNGWSKAAHPLESRGISGIWEGAVPEAAQGSRYKYHVVSRYRN